MMDRVLLEEKLAELPLYVYTYIDPKQLEFSSRIRYICQAECPMYGKSWACPPATGEVDACQKRCGKFEQCLLVGTVVEVNDITDINETLSTRGDHEAITNEIRELMREQGVEPYILSTEACAQCERCAYLDGEPCRMPERMHPCIESHGINVIPVLEENGLEFQYGGNIVTWYSLLFFND